jgi:hypothetical protein
MLANQDRTVVYMKGGRVTHMIRQLGGAEHAWWVSRDGYEDTPGIHTVPHLMYQPLQVQGGGWNGVLIEIKGPAKLADVYGDPAAVFARTIKH